MVEKKWRVRFFQTARGDWPVKTFIEAKGTKTYAKIIRSIELLENYGPFLKPPYSKKMAGNLCELRIIGQQSIRIFYPPSQKTACVNSRMNAKNFLLRRDFAPDEAVGRRYPDREIGELHTFLEGEYYLLHAFDKKSQKTPPKELKTALDRMKELI